MPAGRLRRGLVRPDLGRQDRARHRRHPAQCHRRGVHAPASASTATWRATCCGRSTRRPTGTRCRTTSGVGCCAPRPDQPEPRRRPQSPARASRHGSISVVRRVALLPCVPDGCGNPAALGDRHPVCASPGADLRLHALRSPHSALGVRTPAVLTPAAGRRVRRSLRRPRWPAGDRAPAGTPPTSGRPTPARASGSRRRRSGPTESGPAPRPATPRRWPPSVGRA